MSSTVSNSGTQKPDRQGSRVSLACVQCRTRHLRCDAAVPTCSRCQSEGCQCTYVKSRRGNRPRNQQADNTSSASLPVSEQAWTSILPVSNDEAGASDSAQAGALNSLPSSTTSPFEPFDSVGSGSEICNDNDPLIDLYYSHAWPSQPCTLPQAHLMQRLKDDSIDKQFLLAVIRFVGSFFTDEVDSSPLEQQIRQLEPAVSVSSGPYVVQALVVYSVAVFWSNEVDRAKLLINTATRMATAIGMNERSFAMLHSDGDPLLAESWRRTWWMLYTEDLHMAGAQHEPTFQCSVLFIPSNVELPCEEEDYISGHIPRPKSLEDYECREFNLDGDAGISSFGYLIGLMVALDRGCSHHTYESKSEAVRQRLCAELDAGVEAWRSLLPKSKQRLITNSGKVDELLYRAHFLILVIIVDVHRYLSTLTYDPIESISSCAPLAPPERLAPIYCQEAPVHTAKILDAVERMTALLTIPAKMTTHSPMCVCPIASPVIATLSACKHTLHGEELRVGRERIRLGIGALERFGEIWPRARKVVREVKIIARELLGLSPASAAEHQDQVILLQNLSRGEMVVSSGAPAFETEMFAAFGPSNFGVFGGVHNSYNFGMAGD